MMQPLEITIKHTFVHFEEVENAVQLSLKRGIWDEVLNSLSNPNHVFTSDPTQIATMFETFACFGLSYVGAPVKDRSGATIAVICLLHSNPIENADQWISQSKIVELCDTVGRTLQTYKFDHNYTRRNLFEDM